MPSDRTNDSGAEMARVTPRRRMVVPVVVGTRPEAIKLVPVILALRDSPVYRPLVVSTGQHHAMVEQIFDLVGISPDHTLWSGRLRSDLNERVSSVMLRFEDLCTERFGLTSGAAPSGDDVLDGRAPAAVIVHGDTTSAMAAAMSAFHMRLPVLHVEAGLRTGSVLTPFPEEMNRSVISRLAAMHFAPTATNLENLVRENVPVSRIFVTGNTAIDALQWAVGLPTQLSDARLRTLVASDRRIVVVTAHRRENWGGGLAGIGEGVARLARRFPDVAVVVPAHPNPRVRAELTPPFDGVDNIVVTDPLGYTEFAALLGRAHLVLTDSGGIQEEAPSLDVPVLVLRDSTERGEGVEAGTLELVGTDPDRIETAGTRLLGDDDAHAAVADAPNPYGDGRAAQRIVAALEHLVLGGAPPVPFGAGYRRDAVVAATGLTFPADALRRFVVDADRAIAAPTSTTRATALIGDAHPDQLDDRDDDLVGHLRVTDGGNDR